MVLVEAIEQDQTSNGGQENWGKEGTGCKLIVTKSFLFG